MKIVVIGAGLSGLSTAIALRKYIQSDKGIPLDIKVYDKPEHFADGSPEDREQQRRRRLGAGLGLQSNGLRVLQDIDPELKDRVYTAGFPCDHFTWKTAGGILLGREYVDVLPISRPLLIECLMEAVTAEIIQYKTVSRVVAHEGQKPVIQFEDGSPQETADLVIGADGVGSTVRKSIFEEDQIRPQYLGICAVGGVLETALPGHVVDYPTMTFIMGDTGSFGYARLTQSDKNKLLYWSIYQTELPQRGQPLDHDLLTKQLRERHTNWADPLVGQCLEQAEIDNIYPIFVMPELPHWGRDGCVLVGDSAHALPPRTGQGSSQAFEDGQTLALLLAGYIEQHETGEAVSKSISSLYELRHRRVYKMRSAAMAWKDPSFPMTWYRICLFYAFVFLFVKVRNMMSFFERVDDWDAKVEVKKHFAAKHG